MTPGARALMERMASALERIAAVAEALVEGETEIGMRDGEMDLACEHPLDQRVSFGVTNGAQDFACRACGFRSVSQ